MSQQQSEVELTNMDVLTCIWWRDIKLPHPYSLCSSSGLSGASATARILGNYNLADELQLLVDMTLFQNE